MTVLEKIYAKAKLDPQKVAFPEAHNEKISVESEHGKWCRFTFTLAKSSSPKNLEEKKNGDN